LQSTNFNEFFSMKFYPYKKITIINNPPHKASQISWSHGDQSYEFKTLFIITLCYDNVDDYEFLRL
jgi:hypothetical protein